MSNASYPVTVKTLGRYTCVGRPPVLWGRYRATGEGIRAWSLVQGWQTKLFQNETDAEQWLRTVGSQYEA
jgi:hypothetical protein